MSFFSQVLRPVETPAVEIEPIKDKAEVTEVAVENLQEDGETQDASSTVEEVVAGVLVEEAVVESLTQETIVTDEPTVEESIVQSVGIVRAAGSKAHATLHRFDQIRKHDRHVLSLQKVLNDFRMILAFSQVAKDHNLSSPVVAAFRATPGFTQAVKNFPDTALYNIVPEHTSSASNVTGLESLSEATTQSVESMRMNAQQVVASFIDVLTGLDNTVNTLQEQIEEDKDALGSSDVTDEVLATLPTHTLSHQAFTEIFTKLEEHLQSVDVFNVDELKANPEKIKVEIDGLRALVDDIGHVVGIRLDENGLCEADRNEIYEPSPGDFNEKDITKAGLIFYLDKANTVLDSLKAIAAHKNELQAVLEEASVNVPDSIESDDVTYGCIDHLTLLSSYTTFVTKLIRESVMIVSMLLATVDTVLDVDSGMNEITEAE